MGKNLIQQRRGKGSAIFRAPSFRFKSKLSLPKMDGQARIVDIIDCPGHSSPLMQLKMHDRSVACVPAPLGVRVGDFIQVGPEAKVLPGAVLPLSRLPEGTSIFNIETRPGDGGRLVRASGSSARVVGKSQNRILVQLPSKSTKEFHPECRAIVGVIAGSGKKEKPLTKAGTKHHMMRARNRRYPHVSAVAVNAVAHPFGGSSSSHKGRPTIARRHAPPGAKVGMIRPSRSGRKKRG